MSKLFNIVKTHPKKTIFFTFAGGYATNYFYNRFRDYEQRRTYCDIIQKYGHQKLQPREKLKNLTVLINPAAKKSDSFEKNILPLLGLSGMKVDIIRGRRSAKIRDLAALLDSQSTDAILVVGGDGTAMEFLTGLMRNENFNTSLKHIPIAFAPLGKANNFVSRVVHPVEDLVSWCYKTVEPIIKDSTKSQDVMEIITKDSDSEEETTKRIFCLSSFEWTSLREAESRRDKFWLTGPLRGYCACLWSSAKSEWSQRSKSAKLMYTHPCYGCNKCREPLPPAPKPTWLMTLTGRKPKPPPNLIDYSKVDNPDCGVETSLNMKDSAGIIVNQSDGVLNVKVLAKLDNFRDYTSQCFLQINSSSCDKRESLSAPQITNFQCSSITIIPDNLEREEYFIDNENFEARSITIKLRKDAIKIYSSNKDMNISKAKETHAFS